MVLYVSQLGDTLLQGWGASTIGMHISKMVLSLGGVSLPTGVSIPIRRYFLCLY